MSGWRSGRRVFASRRQRDGDNIAGTRLPLALDLPTALVRERRIPPWRHAVDDRLPAGSSVGDDVRRLAALEHESWIADVTESSAAPAGQVTAPGSGDGPTGPPMDWVNEVDRRDGAAPAGVLAGVAEARERVTTSSFACAKASMIASSDRDPAGLAPRGRRPRRPAWSCS